MDKLDKHKTITFFGDFSLSGKFAHEFLTENEINIWKNVRNIIGKESAIAINIESPYTSESKGIPYK